MKTDARVSHTQKALKEAMLSLLKEKGLRDITVKELCENANVSRATFYKYYKDATDLLEKMESAMVQEYVQSLHLISPDVRQLAEAVYNMVEKNHDLFQVIFMDHHSERHFQYLIDMSHAKCTGCWKKFLKGITDEEIEMLYIFLSNGFLHAITKSYGKVDKEVILHLMEDTIRRCLEPYL